MLPGLLESPATATACIVNLMAGMPIRLVGTVALFLTCRYHMASSSEMIAGMTIGWYVLLTSIEVFVLARSVPRTGRVSFHASTDNPWVKAWPTGLARRSRQKNSAF